MSKSDSSHRACWLLSSLLSMGACAGENGSEGNGELSGESGFGGSIANAGAAGVAGATGFGGALPAGGTASSGGSPATGGVFPTGRGGASSQGGESAATGGGFAAGGVDGRGGAESPDAGSAGMGGSGGANGSELADRYPCNGETSGYDVIASNGGGTWTVARDGGSVHPRNDMRAAIPAAVHTLTPGRTSKESVLVQGSGSISANDRVSLPSYTILNVCGTIDVMGSGEGDKAPIYARGREHIDIPHVTITGAPLYGMFFRDVDDLHIGHAELRVSGGLGIRVDNHGRSNRADKVDSIRIDYAYVEGTSAHGVETYGANEITIGTVVARDTGFSGLLLNDSTNAEVGLVDAIGAGTGTGYAAFRMANDNGAIDGSYPTNIHVGQVTARGGGRGIFCVTRSGGAVIDRIDIAETGSDAILIQNCHNVTIAGIEGSVAGPGDVVLAFDSDGCSQCDESSDIAIQNLTVTDARIRESSCATNSTFTGITLVGGGRMDVCD